ncbi:hypothetical protein [Pelagicoccus mobilis]
MIRPMAYMIASGEQDKTETSPNNFENNIKHHVGEAIIAHRR